MSKKMASAESGDASRRPTKKSAETSAGSQASSPDFSNLHGSSPPPPEARNYTPKQKQLADRFACLVASIV